MQCTARPGVCSRKQQLVQHGSVPQLRIAPVRRLQSGSIRCASDPAKSPILQRRPASVVYSDRQQLSDLIISSSPGAAAPSRRRLRVAVDVDEGAPPQCHNAAATRRGLATIAAARCWRIAPAACIPCSTAAHAIGLWRPPVTPTPFLPPLYPLPHQPMPITMVFALQARI